MDVEGHKEAAGSEHKGRTLDSLVDGTLWGIAAGLLFDSLLMVATTAWLGFMVVPLLVPVLIGAAAGALVARRSRAARRPRARRWGVRALVVLGLFPLCVGGPVLARWAQLRREAGRIPICPNCERGEIRVTVLAFDDRPGYQIDLRSDARPSTCIDFYLAELVKQGWTAQPPRRHLELTVYEFTRARRRLMLGAWEDTSAGDKGAPVSRVSIGCIAANLVY